MVKNCGAVLWLVKKICEIFSISDSDILFRISLTHADLTHSYKQGFEKPTPGVTTTIFLCPQRHYKNSWYRYTACQIKRFKAIWLLVSFVYESPKDLKFQKYIHLYFPYRIKFLKLLEAQQNLGNQRLKSKRRKNCNWLLLCLNLRQKRK